MQPIFDAIGQLVFYVNSNWLGITDAVSKIVGQLFVLYAILQGLLPLLVKLWELIKQYFGFGAKVVSEVTNSVSARVSK